MPRASFLVPVFDREHTLPQALDSLVAQTVTDWECLVVDDGSTDASAQVAHDHAARDERFRVLRLPHAGIVPALNEGLRHCRAPWVARFDSDDVAEPRRLELQLPLLEADPRLAVVDGQVEFFGDVAEGNRHYAAWVNSMVEPEDIDRELLVECPVVHPAATLRKEAVLAVGGYRDGDFPEDYDLWLRLHAAGWRLRKVPEVLVHMRDHPIRLTRTDERYRQQGFREVRRMWLSLTVLATPRRVLLWGAGKEGRAWLRWLVEDRGCEVPAVVDISPRRIGGLKLGRIPVIAPEQIPEVEADLGLVAVGARGARQLIREQLALLKPDWVEGRDWWALR